MKREFTGSWSSIRWHPFLEASRECARGSPGERVSGPVFLKQKRQDWNSLGRRTLRLPTAEQKGQKELSWLGPEDQDSSFPLKEARWVVREI